MRNQISSRWLSALGRAWLASLLALAFLADSARTQTIPYTGGTIVENFDSMGATGTNTPPGWFAGWTGSVATFTTNVTVGDGNVAPTSAGGWNYGTTNATDRALGLIATGTSTPTPPGSNRLVEVRIKNLTSNPITAINVRYDGEEWRTGSSASQVNSNILQFSADGVNFVSLGAAFQFIQPVFTPVTTALDGNAAANRTTNIGGAYTLPSAIATGAVLYLRWFDLNDPSTDPGLAMDNFSFFVPTNSPVAIVSQPTNVTAHIGDLATFSVGASGVPILYQWLRNGSVLSGATNAAFTIPSVSLSDTGSYSVVVSNQFNTIISSNAVLTVLPAISFALVSLTNQWKYDQSGNDLGSAWKETNYNDAAWASGRGVLALETLAAVTTLTNTVLALSNGASQRILTYYFRTRFVCTNNPATVYLSASNLVDDGAVVYLNGVEVYRLNMPSGPVNSSSLAASSVTGAGEGVFVKSVFSSAPLAQGTNVLAVEVHQVDAASSDVVFGLALRAESRTNGPALVILPPVDQTVDFNGDAAFQVVASGTPPLSYQWFFNGAALPAGTADTLALSHVSLVQDGFYSVRVSNALNVATSPPVRLTVRSALTAPLYSTDFQAAIGPEWSSFLTSVTPVGARRFLGEFSNELVRLTLTNLPPHTNVTVAFDLLLIRSWDGTRGDDIWELNVDGTAPLLHSIFQVHDTFTTPPFPHQSFPDPFLTGSNAAFTGASEIDTLGYFYSGNAEDCVYRMTYSCFHTNSSLQINFVGLTDEPIANESWGLDNVRVTLAAGAAEPWSRIVEQPQTQAVLFGTNVALHVTAVGPAAFSYQWRKDGVVLTNDSRITGATTATLNISNIQSSDLGSYTVTVSNAYGIIVSQPAALTFVPPSFQWVRQATGAGGLNESGDGVALDGATHLYVSGNFETSANFGTTNVSAPASGVFLARYTAAGVLEWVRTGTSATAGGEAHNVAVDPLGHCYLTGSFMGTTSFGASNVVSAGGSDVFIAKYDRAGTLLWVTRHGAGFNDSGRGIVADGTNGCFVTGILQTSSDANTARDIFFERYNAAGVLQWQQLPTGPSSDAGLAAATDADHNAYFTGWITSTVNFGSTNLTAAGSLRDMFIAKFNHDGTLLWITQVGGVNADEGKGIGVDTNGNVYVGGSLNLNFNGSNNAEQLRITKFSSTGALLWQRDLLAEFYYFDFSSVTDLGGNTWIFAGLQGTGDFGGGPVTATGTYDGLLAKYNSDGAFVWVKQIGGSGAAIGHRVATDVAGHCYLTGEFNGLANFGSTNLTGAGGMDFFIARLGSETITPPRLALSTSNGLATVEISGAPGDLLQIEITSVLNSGWNILTNVTLPASPARWSDAGSLNQTQRFYRTRLVP